MRRLLLVAFLLFSMTYSYGTHLMGGNIVAEQLSDSTYIITLTAYRDTGGIPFAGTQVLEVYDYSNNLLIANAVGYDPLLSGYLLPSYPYGVEVYVVIDTITFPGPGEYRVTWSNCCRNGAIANMTAPLSESMFLETVVTVYANASNSTPEFLVHPVIYLPVNTPWSYNPLPFDADGDSMHWTLDTPLTTGVWPQLSGNVNGYTYPPADPTGPFTLNPLTGEISWTASTLGNFNATVLVEEYRNGQMIGLIRRDMQLIVIPDTNGMAKITNFDDLPTDANGNITFNLTTNQQFTLSVLASDPNPLDNVYLEAYGAPFFVGNSNATFNVSPTGNGNEIEGVFKWTPTDEHRNFARRYTVVFRVKDDVFINDESVVLKVDWPVGIDEPATFETGAIYPNPVKSTLFIPLALEGNAMVEVKIYNMLGAEVKSLPVRKYNSGNHVIAALMNDVENGQYFVRLKRNGKVVNTQKFVLLNN